MATWNNFTDLEKIMYFVGIPIYFHVFWILATGAFFLIFLFLLDRNTLIVSAQKIKSEESEVILTKISWVYSFWFGWFYYLKKNMPFHAIISFITLNGCFVLFPAFNDLMVSKHYRKKGYDVSYFIKWDFDEVLKRLGHICLMSFSVIMLLWSVWQFHDFYLVKVLLHVSGLFGNLALFGYVPLLAIAGTVLVLDIFKKKA